MVYVDAMEVFDGTRVRALREAKGWSRADLADRAQLHINAVGMIERGERPDPHSSTIAALAYALGVVPGKLFKPRTNGADGNPQ